MDERSPAAGEARAEFEWLFLTEYPHVLRTVAIIVGDRARAEEITQEAFVALLCHRPKISRYERPDAWVRRVAIRLAARVARRERGRWSLEIQTLASQVGPVARDLDLQRALHRLNVRQRAAILLYYFEDRPVAEVAMILDISESAAKVTLHRARRQLQQHLGAMEGQRHGL